VTHKRHQDPIIESKVFTVQEIDLGIKKLKRRIGDVKELDPTAIPYGDESVRTIEHNISEIVREVFGNNSSEFKKHQYHKIYHGPRRIGMGDAERQQCFAEGTTQTVKMLEGLIERLEEKREDILVETVPTTTSMYNISDLHLQIEKICADLFKQGHYPEAVEKSFKVVRDRLRKLTGYETGSEAFGRGGLYVKGAAAENVDQDFNEGVKFLTMAIDKFRNEKSHTSIANIDSAARAYEYLCLSSLAMNLLENTEIRRS